MAKGKTFKKNPFINGALILTAGAFIVKILSAIYRIPYQNIVGDVGFYIYQQIYPFYSIAIALATVGFPVILSKYYAERIEGKKEAEGNELLLSAFTVISIFCFGIFLFIHFGAGLIAEFMGDPNLIPLLQSISYIYLVVPILSVTRGYFQGQNIMVPTAISQVGEQLIRVGLILTFAIILAEGGKSLYQVGQAAMFSSVIGSLFGAVFLLAAITFQKGWTNFSLRKLIPTFSLAKKILIHSLAVAISGLAIILFQLIDSLQLYSSLLDLGYAEEAAKIMKGIFDRGQPILQFALILASSLALSIVPALVSAKSVADFRSQARLGLKVALIIGAATSVGLVLIGESLNEMLFENAYGTSTLRILFFATFFAPINAVMIGILQSAGHVILPAVIVLIGLLAKIIANGILIPGYGITGAAFATNIGLFVITMILRFFLRKMLGKRFVERGTFTHLFSALGMMAFAVFAVFFIVDPLFSVIGSGRLLATVQSLFASAIGAFVFLIAILKIGLFTEQELDMLPYGEKLKRWNKDKVKGDS